MVRKTQTPRITMQTLAVLKVLLDDPHGLHYGLEVSRETGLPSGTLYPILMRLEQAGWLAAEWEQIDPVTAGRRPRRYYRLTGVGASRAEEVLQDASRLLSRTEQPARSRLGVPIPNVGGI